MRLGIATPLFVLLASLALPLQAQAAKSCSAFAKIKSYDASSNTIEVEYERGKERDYFPKPEGTPRDSSKIPDTCRRKVTKETKLAVKPTGGRMSVTQMRSNLDGNMQNPRPEDPAWVPAKLEELIAGETLVVLVVRPGMKKDDPYNVTTVYLPITDEELAEIKRREDEAEDVE